MDDLDLPERLFLKGYPFKRFAPSPNDTAATALTPLRKPLAECIVALVTTAGLSLPGQSPFDKTIKMGDSSFREIPSDVALESLEMNHRSWAFDYTGVLRDRNLALPLDRMDEMQKRGEIGAIAPHHYSFMGSIVGPAKLLKASAPEVARRFAADSVDVVLLTPF